MNSVVRLWIHANQVALRKCLIGFSANGKTALIERADFARLGS
jgi:hypothetical protein